jgi:hypothetical protein
LPGFRFPATTLIGLSPLQARPVISNGIILSPPKGPPSISHIEPSYPTGKAIQQKRLEPMRGLFPRFDFPNMTPEEGSLGKIMTKLPIRKIKVRNRYRKKLGDIESLAASIKDLGFLHPIVVRPDGRLIAGEGRLAAC